MFITIKDIISNKSTIIIVSNIISISILDNIYIKVDMETLLHGSLFSSSSSVTSESISDEKNPLKSLTQNIMVLVRVLVVISDNSFI